MFPAYTSLSFGNLYMVGNYGWVFTNQFISAFISAFFINAFIDRLGNTGVTVFLAIMVVIAALLSGFGKKWDYHVGRRRLPITAPGATPTGVVLPANVARLDTIEEKKDESEEKKVEPVQENNAESVEKKEGEETPDEIPIEDNQEKTISSN